MMMNKCFHQMGHIIRLHDDEVVCIQILENVKIGGTKKSTRSGEKNRLNLI